jgi:hypothetical protein
LICSPVFEPELTRAKPNLTQFLFYPIRAPLRWEFPGEVLAVSASSKKEVLCFIVVKQAHLVTEKKWHLQDALSLVAIISHLEVSGLGALTIAVKAAHKAKLVYVVLVFIIF